MVRYTKAPIREAIIELRFSTEVDVMSLKERLASEFEETGQVVTTEMDFEIEANTVNTAGRQILVGFTFSLDANLSFKVLKDRLVWSQLAAYESWENFIEPMANVWERVREDYQLQSLNRTGVRFINDLAVPFNEGGSVELGEYITVSPRVPYGIPSLRTTRFLSKLEFEHADFSAKSNLSVSSEAFSESNVHILLDIDVYRQYENGFTGTFKELITTLSTLRSLKNQLFESCITGKTRELFE